MPYLNLKVAGPVQPDKLAQLAARLTRVTSEVLRKKESVTALAIDQVPPAAWHIGGRPLAAGETAFFLQVTVTEGTNTGEEKAAFVRAAYAEAAAALPNLNPASYVVVHEERAGAWGYAGITQEARSAGSTPRAARTQPAVSASSVTAAAG